MTTGKKADEGYDEVDLSEIGLTDEERDDALDILAKKKREREAKERAAKDKSKAKKKTDKKSSKK